MSPSVTISTITPGASVYDTTNGTNPTTASLLYTGPLVITANLGIRAIGAENGFSNSAVAAASYSLAQVATPVFDPSQGPITNGTVISVSCFTTGSVIYYTLDGSQPTTNSAIYSVPLQLSGGTVLSAIAVLPGYVDSPLQRVDFLLAQVASPVFVPAPGPVDYGTAVSISCDTPGSQIFYSSDGSTPTTNSTPYTGPIRISSDTNLAALAVAPGYGSTPQSASYTLAMAAVPVFYPTNGPITNGTPITITCATTNATIHYTLDGSQPDTHSPVYSQALLFTNPITLTVYATAPQFDPSAATGVFYGLWSPERTVVTTFAGSQIPGLSNNVAGLARFSNPYGVCLSKSGDYFVADAGNNVIRRISPAGQVSTYAGTGTAGSQLGTATNSQFSSPTGVYMDPAGSLFIADPGNCNRVCKVDTNSMVTSLLIPYCLFSQIAGNGDGDVYSGAWSTVVKIAPDFGITTVAGIAGAIDNGWSAVVNPAVDSSTNLFAATSTIVWKIVPHISTNILAGTILVSALSDGPAQTTLFEHPNAVAVDANGNVFVSDTTTIRKISSTGQVTTLAGTAVAGFQNGAGSVAQFNNPQGMCADTNGNVFVADSVNNCIREISPDTSGIGIPDWWQLAHFGRIGIDPNADPDHDGMSNYQEFWAGTDPLDASSVLRIESPIQILGGQPQIRWATVVGKSYRVEYSTDLVTWKALGTPVQGDGTMATFSDSSADSGPRYYRIALAAF